MEVTRTGDGGRGEGWRERGEGGGGMIDIEGPHNHLTYLLSRAPTISKIMSSNIVHERANVTENSSCTTMLWICAGDMVVSG